MARVIDEAEAHLAAMMGAIRRAQDPRLEARVERFQQSVREMLRTVEEDPRDLTSARRYLGVYLMGARDATIKFADIYARDRDVAAKSDYLMLLTDLEENYVAKTRKLPERQQRRSGNRNRRAARPFAARRGAARLSPRQFNRGRTNPCRTM